jgi:hypothetical protein
MLNNLLQFLEDAISSIKELRDRIVSGVQTF